MRETHFSKKMSEGFNSLKVQKKEGKNVADEEKIRTLCMKQWRMFQLLKSL